MPNSEMVEKDRVLHKLLPETLWSNIETVLRNIGDLGTASSRPSKALIPRLMPGPKRRRCWWPRGSLPPACSEPRLWSLTEPQWPRSHRRQRSAATNAWTTLAADPASRYASCFGSIGPKLYDVGGANVPAVTESFQLTKHKWTTLASVPQAIIFPASAVYKGQLYCIGGWAAWGGPIINNLQIYQP